MTDPFEVLTPVEAVRTLTIRGATIPVAPLVAKQFGPVARHMRPLLEGASNALDAWRGGALSGDEITAQELSLLTTLVEAHCDDLIAAVAAATNQPIDWVGNLLPNELAALASEVWSVNKDFFARTLGSLTAMVTRVPVDPTNH